MQKVSYIGDGTTTEFYFNFPFFENSNVVVTVNNQPATGYTIIGTSAGMDADIPYIGGKVVFEVAPTSIDCITIARQLPLERIVDYQPLSKINPTTLNQDLNYLMEVIKDRKDELLDLMTKYTEIADKESTEIILARISTIHEEIVDIDAKIQALGDIGTLQQRVTDLTTTVGGHTTSINGLDTRTTGMIDYVVESQNPTPENDYTWYRKYKSGWVEQGGIINASSGHNAYIVFPKQMQNDKYTLNISAKSASSTSSSSIHGCHYTTKTASNCSVIALAGNSGDWISAEINWYICGFCG